MKTGKCSTEKNCIGTSEFTPVVEISHPCPLGKVSYKILVQFPLSKWVMD